MKKAALMILLCSVVGYSQECKYQKNQVDEFTKKKVIQTKSAFVNRSGGFVVHFDCLKIDENKYINFDIGNGATIFSCKEGDKMMLLATDGEVVEFTFDSPKISKRSTYTPETISYTFPIDPDTINKLTSLVFSKMRIYTTSGYIEKEIKEKNWIEARETIKCIL